MTSELTTYCDEELRCVECIIGTLSAQSMKGQCDAVMTGTIKHLIEEVLFLRAVLMSHPPHMPLQDAAYKRN